MFSSTGQQVQDRHADGHAVGHLIEDDRVGPSATSDAISTPRFIGPGCMTSTSGFARRTRSAVMPKTLKYSRSDGK